MIEVDLLGKAHGDMPILGPIRFDVKDGEVLAILGPSGIGKSTLLNAIAGVDRDYHGSITRPERLSMVFQEPTLLPWRTALDNITLAHMGLPVETARDSLAKVGLAGFEKRFPRQMSLGQQRRLALARAFAVPPQALILDEPFASLDPGTSADMVALTRTLISEGRPATVLVTHDKHEAETLATRILTLSGTPATLDDRNLAP